MTGEEFTRRFPAIDDYLAFHQRYGHVCCGCVNQDPPLPCCNPGHVDGYPTWTQRDIELLNRAEEADDAPAGPYTPEETK